MRPEVDLAPELIEGLEKIAKWFGTKLDNIYNQMADWHIKDQVKQSKDENKQENNWKSLANKDSRLIKLPITVNMNSVLIAELKSIAHKSRVSLNDIFARMATEYIEIQTELISEYEKISDEEIMYELFGAAWKAKLKQAEKENKKFDAANMNADKIIVFPTT